jgi:RNA polymerase sigma factor (sigma-70 family)
MAAGDLRKGIERLRRALPPPDGGGLSDGQLLGRFLAGGDEAAFAALVRRHGPMVLGVCRRVLRDAHDAEDAFQATFLVLARKAAALGKREAVGSWLYTVAFRAALEARAAISRRRAMERQVGAMPQPEVAPAEPQDWRPLLDQELNALPEKYRSAVVLCDLEGRPRREAARLLGLPEGTLSSRLATARRALAGRLARRGVALSGGGLAGALAGGASAQVPPALVWGTARAAALVAAGQLAAVAPPAAGLTREVLKAMFLAKLKAVAATAVVLAALGGLAWQAGGGRGSAHAAPPGQPPSEVEALRKEVELLRLNLLVVLEKVRAQEAELAALRGKAEAAKVTGKVNVNELALPAGEREAIRLWLGDLKPYVEVPAPQPAPKGPAEEKPPQEVRKDAAEALLAEALQHAAGDPVRQAEAVLKALREARDPEAKRRAAEALEKAARQLRGQPPKPGTTGNPPARP